MFRSTITIIMTACITTTSAAQEPSSMQPSPKEECGQFLQWQESWEHVTDDISKSMRQSMIVSHAELFAASLDANGLPPTQLSDQQQSILANDLNGLLNAVWQIEMTVIRRLYKGPGHTG